MQIETETRGWDAACDGCRGSWVACMEIGTVIEGWWNEDDKIATVRCGDENEDEKESLLHDRGERTVHP